MLLAQFVSKLCRREKPRWKNGKWQKSCKCFAVWLTLGAFKHEKVCNIWKALEIGYNLGTIVQIQISSSIGGAKVKWKQILAFIWDPQQKTNGRFQDVASKNDKPKKYEKWRLKYRRLKNVHQKVFF